MPDSAKAYTHTGIRIALRHSSACSLRWAESRWCAERSEDGSPFGLRVEVPRAGGRSARQMRRRLVSALTFWAVLLAWAIWITREPKHTEAFGFAGGCLWTVFATLLQDLGRRRFQPPLERRSIPTLVALQLAAGGITVAGW